MKKLSYCFITFFVLLLPSCSSIELLTFDQLYPAEMSFPEQIGMVGVVNNMPSSQELKENILKSGMLEGDGKSAAEVFASKLADSKYFDQVVICDSALCDEEPHEYLSGGEVDNLVSMLGVDILFSFEKLKVDVQKKNYYLPDWEMPIPVISAEVSPEIAVYLPGRDKPVIIVNPKDTVLFDVESRLSEKVLMDEVVEQVSSLVCNKLVPYWKPISRVYFDGGNVEMRDAAVCVKEGDWEGARSEWMNLYNRLKKGNNKFRAAFNIALSYEMTGDMQKAEDWLDKSAGFVSDKSLDEQTLNYYKKELSERLSVFSKLKIQMDRFNQNF